MSMERRLRVERIQNAPRLGTVKKSLTSALGDRSSRHVLIHSVDYVQSESVCAWGLAQISATKLQYQRRATDIGAIVTDVHLEVDLGSLGSSPRDAWDSVVDRFLQLGNIKIISLMAVHVCPESVLQQLSSFLSEMTCKGRKVILVSTACSFLGRSVLRQCKRIGIRSESKKRVTSLPPATGSTWRGLRTCLENTEAMHITPWSCVEMVIRESAFLMEELWDKGVVDALLTCSNGIIHAKDPYHHLEGLILQIAVKENGCGNRPGRIGSGNPVNDQRGKTAVPEISCSVSPGHDRLQRISGVPGCERSDHCCRK